jgi:hypothetical protein
LTQAIIIASNQLPLSQKTSYPPHQISTIGKNKVNFFVYFKKEMPLTPKSEGVIFFTNVIDYACMSPTPVNFQMTPIGTPIIKTLKTPYVFT